MSGIGFVETARLLPPRLPSPHIARPRLDERLEDGARTPVTTLLAGPGYGKSTALAAWAGQRRVCWYACDADDARMAPLLRGLAAALRTRVPTLPPELSTTAKGTAGPDGEDPERAEALAALLAEAVDAGSGGDVHLVVDGAERLSADSPGARLLTGLARQRPATLHLLIASRSSLPAGLSRLAARGEVTELDARSLAFRVDETAALLEAVDADAALAERVHTATGGWPAASRLVAEALRQRSGTGVQEVLRRLGGPGGPLHTLLLEEVVERELPDRRTDLGRLALLERFTVELCAEVGVAEPAALLDDLERRGLLTDDPDGEGWRAFTPVAREAMSAAVPLGEEARTDLWLTAAGWLERAGQPHEALQLLRAAGRHDALATLLERDGQWLVAQGLCAEVTDAAQSLPETLRSQAVRLVEGQARQVLGDWEGALGCYAHVAGSAGPLRASLAWRMGLIHHFRGELDAALAVYERGLADEADAAGDRATLHGWAATACWLQGDFDRCRALAKEAFTAAQRADDAGALAIAHTAMALVAAADGDRRANDLHYLRALAAAEEAGDVLQLLRIRCNRGSRYLEEGSYAEAIAELERGLRLAEASGYVALHGVTLCNRGQARWHLGRLEEAIADYEAARALYQRIDSRMVSYPLGGLGDIYRERGDLTLARACYEEAIEIAREAGDAQGLVPALAGLARVLVADDPERAAGVAAEALSHEGTLAQVDSQLAAGWVALGRDDRAAAQTHSKEAAQLARGRRDRPGVAESLELEALSATDPREARNLLEEAAGLWRSLGSVVREARTELAIAWVDDDAGRAARWQRRLRELGVTARASDAAGTLRQVAEHTSDEVIVQLLGGFAVRRSGELVAPAPEEPPEARELLKVLAVRRGRPIPFDQLVELLWGDDPPDDAHRRLAGAVDAARRLLGSAERAGGAHPLIATTDAVALSTSGVTVDVEAFLVSASEGLSRLPADPDAAAELLTAAEMAYTGDVLEADPYAEWAMALREEARTTYIAVLRALAGDALARDRPVAAVRFLLRILERDPYDERAHLDLVRALVHDRRHGEARRRYRAYAARMTELGIDPEPFATAAG